MTRVASRHQALLNGTALCVHGRASTYDVYGCRCDDCRRAVRERAAADRLARSERLRADPSIVSHGRSSTYINWGCRCVECTEVHSLQCRTYFHKRKADLKEVQPQ